MFSYLAFGLHWQSDLPLTQFPFDPSDCCIPDVTVSQSDHPVPNRQLVSRWHNTWLCEDGFRFQSRDAACFDYYDAGRLDVFPSPKFLAVSASHFYGTVAAAIAAYNGGFPVHGTTMASGGLAVLICGPAGAGKSSTAAALAAMGFRLVSDDLSVFRLDTRSQPVASTGRMDIRLVPAAARLLQASLHLSPSGEQSAFGKVLMRPPLIAPNEQVPLRSVIFLQTAQPEWGQDRDPGWKIKFLSENVFRPRLMQRLPGTRVRAQLLLKILGTARMRSLMTPQGFNDQTAEELASRIAEFHHS